MRSNINGPVRYKREEGVSVQHLILDADNKVLFHTVTANRSFYDETVTKRYTEVATVLNRDHLFDKLVEALVMNIAALELDPKLCTEGTCSCLRCGGVWVLSNNNKSLLTEIEAAEEVGK